jgi:hypothetical protein
MKFQALSDVNVASKKYGYNRLLAFATKNRVYNRFLAFTGLVIYLVNACPRISVYEPTGIDKAKLEEDNAIFLRQNELIRHVRLWDYEHALLEYFEQR